MIAGSVFCEVLHLEAICIKFNVTALIKMWHFLEGISSPSAEKQGEAEAGALYATRCDVF